MFAEDIQAELFAKIAVRLLYERRWIFHDNDKNYYDYLYHVSDYLRKWDKRYLWKVKDSFIEKTDPVFLTVQEIEHLKQQNRKNCYLKKLFKIGWVLEKLPVIKQIAACKKGIMRYRNDFYWYITNIYDSVKQTSGGSSVNKDIMENRLLNLEADMVALKGRLNDIWWLSWNMHDVMKESGSLSGSTDRMLRYYPTWIPCEYPEYFKGNNWHWSDKFKEYYITHYNDCSFEMEKLFEGLKSDDIEYLKLLWERNTKILPYAAYTEQEAYLMKVNFLFTGEELAEQNKIFRMFSDITAGYILPNGTVYEIPVFYYEHGLKAASGIVQDYIRQGDILDLGGFIGDSALVLSKYTDKVVYSVEMNPANIEKMEIVIKDNGIVDRVVPILCAVSDQDTVGEFFGDSSYSTLNKINDSMLYKEKTTVNIYKVDTLVSEYRISPHFIKMDVEGMEYDTVMGAKETICKFRPILSISIYHTPKDFLKIKPLLESWNLDYRFHIENHNPFDPVYEKMLVCIPEPLNSSTSPKK